MSAALEPRPARPADATASETPGDGTPSIGLPPFAHIERRWDPRLGSHAVKLLPGDYYVTTRAELITTVLGSCVSACVRDTTRSLGGMNHFMLPLAGEGDARWSGDVSAATRYGNVAMERLVCELLKAGARREHLEFKLVGGGRVLAATTDVGARNIEFVRGYLHGEGYRIAGEDLGGSHARQVNYFPATGRVQVRRLASERNAVVAARERHYLRELGSTAEADSG